MLIVSDMVRYSIASTRLKGFRAAGGGSMMTQLLIVLNGVQMCHSLYQ
jgi:hypothetical protein